MSAITYAELDLTALQYNFSVVRSYASNAKIMAVIKANAYGHGLCECAKALPNADAFAVARLNEAILLRKSGCKQRILVLTGFMSATELKKFSAYKLEAVIHDPEQITILQQASINQALTVWLKLDTGMHRLGFSATEFLSAYQSLQQIPAVNLAIHLMTHLANAEDKSGTITLAQINLFNNITETLVGECSIANSAAILSAPAAISDWVRPGLMLYGISPFAEKVGADLGLKPVMSLYSKLIAIKSLKHGDAVGYNGTWIADKPTKFGVVAIGYGDGYPRHAPTGTPVLIRGQRVPIIGRISMDMLTVDLNDTLIAKVGDQVTLWGHNLPVEEIATNSNTIPYTLVCGITPRVNRNYLP